MAELTWSEAIEQAIIQNGYIATLKEIYQIAREKQYYVPAAPATPEEIAHVRSIVTRDSMS